MKKRHYLFVTFILLSTLVKAQFMYSFKDAQKLAIATNKFMLLDFTASWCGPCKAMDANTWSKEEVQTLMNNFISVKIDIDNERLLASRYSVRSIPNIFIVDSNGEVVYQSVGYKDKNKMKAILKKYMLNATFLQNEQLAYYQKKTGDNALHLSEKYLDFAIYIDKSLRVTFLKVADNYISNSKKLFKKEGHKHKNEQKIKLLFLYRKLIRGKYEKVLSSLQKDFKKETIKEENTMLFNFLHFSSYMKLKDKENAKLWYQKIAKSKEAKVWLLKSRKI